MYIKHDTTADTRSNSKQDKTRQMTEKDKSQLFKRLIPGYIPIIEPPNEAQRRYIGKK